MNVHMHIAYITQAFEKCATQLIANQKFVKTVTNSD